MLKKMSELCPSWRSIVQDLQHEGGTAASNFEQDLELRAIWQIKEETGIALEAKRKANAPRPDSALANQGSSQLTAINLHTPP